MDIVKVNIITNKLDEWEWQFLKYVYRKLQNRKNALLRIMPFLIHFFFQNKQECNKEFKKIYSPSLPKCTQIKNYLH